MSTEQAFLPSTIHRGGRRQYQRRKWRASTIRCLLISTALFTLLLWTTLSLLGLQHANEGDNDSAASSSSSSSSSLLETHNIPAPKATIAYAVSLTSCGNARNSGGHSSDPSFHEGAAVLKHSIHLASTRNYHQSKSLFDYEVCDGIYFNEQMHISQFLIIMLIPHLLFCFCR